MPVSRQPAHAHHDHDSRTVGRRPRRARRGRARGTTTITGCSRTATATALAIAVWAPVRRRWHRNTAPQGEHYPAALELGELYGPDALGVLAVAPTPSLGRALSRKRIAAAITRAGRQRRVEERAAESRAFGVTNNSSPPPP